MFLQEHCGKPRDVRSWFATSMLMVPASKGQIAACVGACIGLAAIERRTCMYLFVVFPGLAIQGLLRNAIAKTRDWDSGIGSGTDQFRKGRVDWAWES